MFSRVFNFTIKIYFFTLINPFQPSVSSHIETSHLIFTTNAVTGKFITSNSKYIFQVKIWKNCGAFYPKHLIKIAQSLAFPTKQGPFQEEKSQNLLRKWYKTRTCSFFEIQKFTEKEEKIQTSTEKIANSVDHIIPVPQGSIAALIIEKSGSHLIRSLMIRQFHNKITFVKSGKLIASEERLVDGFNERFVIIVPILVSNMSFP